MVVKSPVGRKLSYNFRIRNTFEHNVDVCFGDIAESGPQAQMQNFEIPAGGRVNLHFFHLGLGIGNHDDTFL